MIKTHSLVIIFSLSLLLSGCMIPLSISSGTRIQTEQLNKIQPGKTTKNEVFEWIGPPIAVLASSEFYPVPMPFIFKEKPATTRHARSFIQSDTFFELFSSQHQFHEYHRVYYFYYAVSRWTNYSGVFVNVETTKTKFDKLWLLVNEKTGIVEDYKFRKGI